MHDACEENQQQLRNQIPTSNQKASKKDIMQNYLPQKCITHDVEKNLSYNA